MTVIKLVIVTVYLFWGGSLIDCQHSGYQREAFHEGDAGSLFYSLFNLTSRTTLGETRFAQSIVHIPIKLIRSGTSQIRSFYLYPDDVSFAWQLLLAFCVDNQIPFSECIVLHGHMIAQLAKQGFHLQDAKHIELYSKYYAFVDLCLLNEYESAVVQELQRVADSDNRCRSGWLDIESLSNEHIKVYVAYHDEAGLDKIRSFLYQDDPSLVNDRNSINQSAFTANSAVRPVQIVSTKFFEYIMYRDVIPFVADDWQTSTVQYVALTSYKTLSSYHGLCAFEVNRVMSIGLKHNLDVVPLIRSSRRLLVGGVMAHTLAFKTAWDLLLQAMGFSISTIRRFDNIIPFYRNSMLIKPSWLQRLTIFMNNAANIAMLNESVHAAMNSNAEYISGDEGVSRRIFQLDSGYQLFPFVFERLPSFFFAVYGATVCGPEHGCELNVEVFGRRS